MSYKQKNNDPHKTLLVITVGMLLVYFFSKNSLFFYIAVSVGLAGVLSTYIARKIDFVWMKLAWVLSLILPNIVLSVIFYLFLTPIALLSRIFGEKNQLNLKNTKTSLFKDVNKKFEKSSFEKMW